MNWKTTFPESIELTKKEFTEFEKFLHSLWIENSRTFDPKIFHLAYDNLSNGIKNKISKNVIFDSGLVHKFNGRCSVNEDYELLLAFIWSENIMEETCNESN